MSDIRTRSSYDWHMSSNTNSMLFAMYMPGICLAYSGGSGLPMMQKTLIEKSRNIVAKASVGRACGTNARNAEAHPCPMSRGSLSAKDWSLATGQHTVHTPLAVHKARQSTAPGSRGVHALWSCIDGRQAVRGSRWPRCTW